MKEKVALPVEKPTIQTIALPALPCLSIVIHSFPTHLGAPQRYQSVAQAATGHQAWSRVRANIPAGFTLLQWSPLRGVAMFEVSGRSLGCSRHVFIGKQKQFIDVFLTRSSRQQMGLHIQVGVCVSPRASHLPPRCTQALPSCHAEPRFFSCRQTYQQRMVLTD